MIIRVCMPILIALTAGCASGNRFAASGLWPQPVVDIAELAEARVAEASCAVNKRYFTIVPSKKTLEERDRYYAAADRGESVAGITSDSLNISFSGCSVNDTIEYIALSTSEDNRDGKAALFQWASRLVEPKTPNIASDWLSKNFDASLAELRQVFTAGTIEMKRSTGLLFVTIKSNEFVEARLCPTTGSTMARAEELRARFKLEALTETSGEGGPSGRWIATSDKLQMNVVTRDAVVRTISLVLVEGDDELLHRAIRSIAQLASPDAPERAERWLRATLQSEFRNSRMFSAGISSVVTRPIRPNSDSPYRIELSVGFPETVVAPERRD